MESYWDMLPEDICILIYKKIHKEYMENIIIQIKNNYDKYDVFEYWTNPIYNYWYIGTGLKALKPKHWGNIYKYHKRYNSLYHSSYNKTY